MKNLLQTLLVLAMILISVPGKADEGKNQNIKKAIRMAVSIPQSLKKTAKPQIVKVYFSVNECGQVSDVIICSEDKNVISELDTQFRKMVFTDLVPGSMNSIELKFVFY